MRWRRLAAQKGIEDSFGIRVVYVKTLANAESKARQKLIRGEKKSGASLMARDQTSLTTARGSLSSRRAMKTGCLNLLSRVHSANLICATNFGFTQCIFFIIDGVMPCTHAPPCFEGRSTNGQSSRSSVRNFLYNIDNDFSLKPLPTLPAKFNFSFS